MNAIELDEQLRLAFGESEAWDKDGIQIDCGNEITKAVVALDCTTKAIEFAARSGASAILCHHPLIFEPLKRVSVRDSAGKRVSLCIKNGLSVLAYHTCLDIAKGGVNDRLCGVLGIQNTDSFLPFGRFGCLEKETPLMDFVKICERALGTKVQNVLDSQRPVKKIAVVAGGGKEYVKDAVATGADTYLTGKRTTAP